MSINIPKTSFKIIKINNPLTMIDKNSGKMMEKLGKSKKKKKGKLSLT